MWPQQHGQTGHAKRKRATDDNTYGTAADARRGDAFAAAPTVGYAHTSFSSSRSGMWETRSLPPPVLPPPVLPPPVLPPPVSHVHASGFRTASELLQGVQTYNHRWPLADTGGSNNNGQNKSIQEMGLAQPTPSSVLYNSFSRSKQSIVSADSFWTKSAPTNAVSSFSAQIAVPQPTQYMMDIETAVAPGPRIDNDESCKRLDEDEMVCFGVIGGIAGKCERPPSSKTSAVYEATILSPSRFTITGAAEAHGHIAADHSFLLQDMLDSGIKLRVRCSFENGAREHRKLLSCRLEIVIYAPFSMPQEIKEWSEHNEVYLQDPTFCFQDAKYCNPQRLSLHFDTPRLVSEILPDATGHLMRLRSITDDDDFLDKYLASKVALPETPQPSAIQTILKSHQRQALTFMLRRERGWALRGPEADMWSIFDNANGRFYINALSGSGSKEPPPPFCGGVIADPMGLGKTLTMIALAATDLENVTAHGQFHHLVSLAQPPSDLSLTTKVLRVWESQLSEHTVDGALKFARHHAKSKLTSFGDIAGVDVVLTTYHTLSAEWSETGKTSSLLFSVKWKRIVLDEAHIIRNESSRMCRAMCSLEAECRWAVTGTPIQNHLSDLASLLKFIRAHPYETRKQFEADISDYWKDGKAQEAARRLQLLSSCLFLRRPKSTIQLPRRYNKEYPVDFTPREREEYNNIKHRTTSAIDDALQQGLGSHRSGAYANILQQIEALRLFCGLGLHYHARHDDGSIATHHTVAAAPWDAVAQKTFKLHLEMGSLHCSQCHATIDLAQTMFDDATTGVPLFSRCLKFVCAECAAKLSRRGFAMPCGHTPSCPTAQVSTSVDAMDQAVDDQASAAPLSTQMPSKIVALISDLKSQPVHVKSIVFSTWRLTLNVVAVGLEQAGIEYLRFDGSIPQKDRHEILQKFKQDPAKRVLLLTYSCGAVGLTLTEASRAYLLEPHWNPTIEEQALGRICRIGQDKEVTTVRLFVRDSFETHVMNVQQSKKDLAQVALAPHDGGLADTTLEKLQWPPQLAPACTMGDLVVGCADGPATSFPETMRHVHTSRKPSGLPEAERRS
ncbi:hypothetical protein PWT90_00499 [Aphanocladium album]|nr:hypothetical protein PWT90_00499 [Aphanocladium album]